MCRPSILFVSTCLVAVAVAIAACGGNDEPLTLEEYFSRLEELDRQADEDSAPIETRTSEDESIDAFKTALPESATVLETFVNGVDAIEPPSEVADEHNEAVAAGREFMDEFRRLVDDSADLTSVEELGPLFLDSAYTAAAERFTASCDALQTIADDNNVDVDLDCDETG